MTIPTLGAFLEWIRTQAGLGIALAFILEWAQRTWPDAIIFSRYMVLVAFVTACALSTAALSVQIAIGTAAWNVETVWASIATAFIVSQAAYAVARGIKKAK